MRHQIRWTSKKIAQRVALIEKLEYIQRQPLPNFFFKKLNSPTDLPLIDFDAGDQDWEVIGPGDYWGTPRLNFILRTEFRLPEGWQSKGDMALYLPIGIAGDFSHPEALAYIDGEAFAAVDRHHQEIRLPEKWLDGNTHALVLHGWTGIGGSTMGDLNKKLQMRECSLVQIHQTTRDLIALARVALEISNYLDENQSAHHHLLNGLDQAFKQLDIREPVGDAFYDSVPLALETLRQGIEKSGQPLDVEITAIGHAHIDVAWLWTLGQTRQKAGRTFHNVLRLMEQFPDYRFTQSQPQLYEYVRQDFPKLFEEIKTRIEEKRWEVIGGMWVEADCNLSGSESLARQFLLGRNFYRQHFGKKAETPVLWLPDVFGYAWNLPQLIKESGLDYFFTIKIGWSQYNRLPFDSFWWQGLDGTKILTHFSTTKNPESVHASTYNADASPRQTLGTWFNFQQKDYGEPGQVPPLLMSYGWGDGGGGPTREMLENIGEMERFPGTPQIQPGTVKEFFRKLEAASGELLPTWNGELYLEYHRGTYTTQAQIKRANRKSEFLLHDAEFLAAFASLLDPNYEYPLARFTQAWQLVCLNQFHDIIPGSSIRPVYEEALEQYQEVGDICEAEKEKALRVIAKEYGGDFLVVNPTSFWRDEIIFLRGEVDGGEGPAVQAVEGGRLVRFGKLGPYSVTALEMDDLGEGSFEPVEMDEHRLENAYLWVEFNRDGDIVRMYDKQAAREVLPEGAVANQFQAFEDIPLSWDAWDIDIFYDDKQWLADPATSIRVVEAGPLRGTIEIKRKILNSSYTQRVSLSCLSPRLDFDTCIDWKERKILLKTAFPVDVLAPSATYEIQWGNVERPTHRNTSWDWARFETAAQKWVDLSEGGYGVSLLNDCKYGHDIYGNVMRLTLLRGPTAPDPDADLGEHRFTYSLYPHLGRWDENTISEAYALNDPVLAYLPEAKLPKIKENPESLVRIDKPNIVIETIKQAEDGEGIVVRVYESQRKRVDFKLETSFPMREVWQCNILEENKTQIETQDENQLNFSIRPYQILTLRLVPVEKR